MSYTIFSFNLFQVNKHWLFTALLYSDVMWQMSRRQRFCFLGKYQQRFENHTSSPCEAACTLDKSHVNQNFSWVWSKMPRPRVDRNPVSEGNGVTRQWDPHEMHPEAKPPLSPSLLCPPALPRLQLLRCSKSSLRKKFKGHAEKLPQNNHRSKRFRL